MTDPRVLVVDDDEGFCNLLVDGYILTPSETPQHLVVDSNLLIELP